MLSTVKTGQSLLGFESKVAPGRVAREGVAHQLVECCGVFLVATYSKHILLCITKQAAPRSPLDVVASRSVRDLVAPPGPEPG